MTQRKKQLVWVAVVILVVVALDQATKIAIDRGLPRGDTLLGGGPRDFFYLTHQRNPGLVGGMFRDAPLVVLVAPVAAMAVLVYLYRHLDVDSRLQTVAYGMVAGGAVGNQIDRFARGEVVDFLQFHFWFVPFDFPWKLYPAFNVADSCICVGVVLLVAGWHWSQPREEADVPDAS